jgi:hypothetical protein
MSKIKEFHRYMKCLPAWILVLILITVVVIAGTAKADDNIYIKSNNILFANSTDNSTNFTIVFSENIINDVIVDNSSIYLTTGYHLYSLNKSTGYINFMDSIIGTTGLKQTDNYLYATTYSVLYVVNKSDGSILYWKNYNQQLNDIYTEFGLGMGLQGPQGPQGLQGIPGVNGTNGTNGTNAYVLCGANLSCNVNDRNTTIDDNRTTTGQISFWVDNNSNVIPLGFINNTNGSIFYNGSLNKITFIGDVAGSVTIDVYKGNFTTYPTLTKIGTITVTTALKYQDTTFFGFTTTNFIDGDYFAFDITSASLFTWIRCDIKTVRVGL